MLKELEFVMLKTFNDNLTDHERNLVALYLKTIPPPTDDQQRRRNNLMAMSFIEGTRLSKNSVYCAICTKKL